MTTFPAALAGEGNTLGIPVPEEIVLGFDRGKRVKVVVTLNGYSYRSSVAPYKGEYMVSLSSENRAAAGVSAGETVDVTLEVDDAPRLVEVPADLQAALDANPTAQAAWSALSYSKQSAHALSVTGAKAADTRARRVGAVISSLG